MTEPLTLHTAATAPALAGAGRRSRSRLAQAQAGAPIRIGSTLALTGPLSATAQVHKIVGEIYVEQLNKRGGLLGRPVEWIVKDDQSKPDLARTLYEQLVTADKVDLLMGPYATGAILSAMGVAQRYNKVLVHHTLGMPVARQVRHAVPGLVARLRSRRHGAEHAVRRAGRRAEAAEDGGGRDQQVPVDPLHVARRARGRSRSAA